MTNINNLKFKKHYKRNLPHFQNEGGTYALSFRLSLSLPQYIINEMKQSKNYYKENLKKIIKENVEKFKREFYQRYFEKFDDFLDRYDHPDNYLRNRECAQIVADTLHYWDTKRYHLFAYCIMANHAHLLIKPLIREKDEYFSLATIMHSIKRHTAFECNRFLNRSGQFWLHESYDHEIRNEDDFVNQLNYIKQNPVKARLVKDWKQWEFTYVNDEYPKS